MPNPRFDDQVIFQVAFVTPDIEKTKRWMAEFFDMKVPETIVTGELPETEAEYRGEPMPAALQARLLRVRQHDAGAARAGPRTLLLA